MLSRSARLFSTTTSPSDRLDLGREGEAAGLLGHVGELDRLLGIIERHGALADDGWFDGDGIAAEGLGEERDLDGLAGEAILAHRGDERGALVLLHQRRRLEIDREVHGGHGADADGVDRDG